MDFTKQEIEMMTDCVRGEVISTMNKSDKGHMLKAYECKLRALEQKLVAAFEESQCLNNNEEDGLSDYYARRTRDDLIQEREAGIDELREVCAIFGDNYWDDNLRLQDIILKHLHRPLMREDGKVNPKMKKVCRMIVDASNAQDSRDRRMAFRQAVALAEKVLSEMESEDKDAS